MGERPQSERDEKQRYPQAVGVPTGTKGMSGGLRLAHAEGGPVAQPYHQKGEATRRCQAVATQLPAIQGSYKAVARQLPPHPSGYS